ncbi:MAG: 6-carboxytetrahydropterin synthase [Planctomycetes bacterium]|nr:6-carboxytetrahydropterin synthase [Planctomycetota bacterium]
MYSVAVEETFSAGHQVRQPDGSDEPHHRHDWRVRAVFARAELDGAGMVVDFAQAQSCLRRVLAHLDRHDLNELACLGSQNPTAEVVARYVFECVQRSGIAPLARVEVTEAPGCLAAFEPTASAPATDCAR